jgi:hypothetical protein
MAGETLTINGTNFVSGAAVTFNGVSHSVTFVSSDQLTVSLSSSDLATSGSYPVVVTNPSGASSNAVNFSATSPTTSDRQIPESFFGMHMNYQQGSFPLLVNFGSFRFWDTGQNVEWQGMHLCSGHTPVQCQANVTLSSFDFSGIDTLLASLKVSSIANNLYTGGRVPVWASGNPSGTGCNYGDGTCYLPTEMNVDGSCTGKLGSISTACSIWDYWLINFATHVNSPTYLQTHADIKYWEPWNEWFVDRVTNPTLNWPTQEVNATWAQMLRLTEDMRCIITGTGTIHNFPTAGSSALCATYLADIGQSGAIDPNALIIMPSGDPNNAVDRQHAQNFLYCNDSPTDDLGSSSSCAWAPIDNNPANCNASSCWGGAAIDIINYHFYVPSQQPEFEATLVTAIRNILSPTDKAKPLINGEGSSGGANFGNYIWNDGYSQMGFVPRFYALSWSYGITLSYWYTYGALAPLVAAPHYNTLTQLGTAWQTTYNWLVGSTPVNVPFCSATGTVYTCPLKRPNGKPAELVWDSQFGPGGTTGPANCTAVSNRLICGNTAYTVPAEYRQDWVDIQGRVHPFQPTVTVGAVPILLE